MSPVVWILVPAAFIGSVALTALVRSAARRYGITDDPDGLRKTQAEPVPLWGGIAVFTSFCCMGAVAWTFATDRTESLDWLAAMVLVSTSLIFILGLVDDSFELRGRTKLACQIAATLPVAVSVHWFDRVALLGNELQLGLLAWPLSLLWLVGCINAMNLLDGMDGNASVVTMVASAAIAAIAYHHAHPSVSLLAMILAGAVLGFFVFNRPPATIYLGDSGSTVMGLLLAVLCMEAAAVSAGTLRLAVPTVVMAIPLLDTSLAVLRRRLTGRRFDCADRGHIHHRLLERGMHKWQALALITGLSVVLGVGALASSVLNSEPLAWFSVLAVVVSMTHLRYFGNHEWSLVKMSLAARIAPAAGTRLAIVDERQSPNRAAIGSLRFDESWNGLLRELKQWPARQLEFSFERGRSLGWVQTWEGAAAAPELNRWQVVLTFGATDGGRLRVALSGDDALSSQPWYLPRLTAALERFGRHWAAYPEVLHRQHLAEFGVAPVSGREAA
ncbi:MAG TPA: MraY family glycosyltransferase [Pirellulales bacterium]|nr:MraY family glycosyltransferase [Pirellulales bacterium]